MLRVAALLVATLICPAAVSAAAPHRECAAEDFDFDKRREAIGLEIDARQDEIRFTDPVPRLPLRADPARLAAQLLSRFEAAPARDVTVNVLDRTLRPKYTAAEVNGESLSLTRPVPMLLT
jgi:hypothetical protein